MDQFTSPQNTNSSVPPTPPTPLAPPTPQMTPPPPPTELRIHTMAGDIASIQKSGGAPAEPQVVTINPSVSLEPAAPAATLSPAPAALPSAEPGTGHKVLVWLAALIIVVGFASLIYAYGLPYFSSSSEDQTAASAPIEKLVAPTPAPAPEPTPPPPPPTPVASPFGTPYEALAAVTLPDTTLNSTLAALQAASAEKPATGNFKEFKALDAQGTPLSFSTYLSILLPEMHSAGLAETFSAAFEPSFAAYFFYDDRGAWPGYIVKLNPASGIDIVTLTDRLQKLETSSFGNFFLNQPGAPQEFKSGQALGKYADRYAAFSEPGALFSYGLFGDYFIINTSNEGLKQVLQKLAL